MSKRPSKEELETRLERALEQEDLAFYMRSAYPVEWYNTDEGQYRIEGWEAAWDARLWMLSGLTGGLLVALGREGETK